MATGEDLFGPKVVGHNPPVALVGEAISGFEVIHNAITKTTLGRVRHTPAPRAGTQSGRSYDVVAAGVAQLGERVVLRDDRDRGALPLTPADRLEGGSKPRCPLLDLETQLYQFRYEERRGLELLVPQLRLVVDSHANFDEPLSACIDLL